jgi:hypothetical protein
VVILFDKKILLEQIFFFCGIGIGIEKRKKKEKKEKKT